MNIPNENLGITIMQQDVNLPEATVMGMVEGISDVAKFLTIAAIATGLFIVIPDRWINAAGEKASKLWRV